MALERGKERRREQASDKQSLEINSAERPNGYGSRPLTGAAMSAASHLSGQAPKGLLHWGSSRSFLPFPALLPKTSASAPEAAG